MKHAGSMKWFVVVFLVNFDAHRLSYSSSDGSHVAPNPKTKILILNLEWLSYFEHAIQSLRNICLLVFVLGVT